MWHWTAAHCYILELQPVEVGHQSLLGLEENEEALISFLMPFSKNTQIYCFALIVSFTHLFLRCLKLSIGFLYSKCQWRSFLSYRIWIFLDSKSTTVLVSFIIHCLVLVDLQLTFALQSTEWHSLVTDTKMSLMVSLESLLARRFQFNQIIPGIKDRNTTFTFVKDLLTLCGRNFKMLNKMVCLYSFLIICGWSMGSMHQSKHLCRNGKGLSDIYTIRQCHLIRKYWYIYKSNTDKNSYWTENCHELQ